MIGFLWWQDTSWNLQMERLEKKVGAAVSPDAVVVEVVEDGQAALVALAVVWLGTTGPGGIYIMMKCLFVCHKKSSLPPGSSL